MLHLRNGFLYATLGSLSSSRIAQAIELNVEDQTSLKNAASAIADDMMSYYTGNQPGQIPGLLPGPYYWWEAGAMWASLIDYWYYTGDTKWNSVVSEALLFQTGPKANFMPPNQTQSLGNDDQSFWALAALSAAETNFPNPPEDQPQWLALAEAVFNTQAARWDNDTCGGGLKWQIFPFNIGYAYKNTISNGCFFNMAARLGMYTHNTTYFKWANRSWNWTETIGLLGDSYEVFDGSDDAINCTEINHTEWSYNMGVYLFGAAVMWNQTEGAVRELWAQRVSGLLAGASKFFDKQVMVEISCEPYGRCNIDQQSFKAYTARWMAASTKVAPWIYDTVKSYLSVSAEAAARSCTGGDNGRQCGTKWNTGTFDGQTGVGQQMSALEVIQSNMIDRVRGPLTSSNGGTSKGNPSAGADSDDLFGGKVGAEDVAGAVILTVMMVLTVLATAWWMVM